MIRYEKYKDSGIEWIGEIPEGWVVKKLKFVFERIFSVESGCGYPAARKVPQQASRKKLEEISKKMCYE